MLGVGEGAAARPCRMMRPTLTELLVELIVGLEDKDGCDSVEMEVELEDCRRTRQWAGRISPNATSVDKQSLHVTAIGIVGARIMTLTESQDERT